MGASKSFIKNAVGILIVVAICFVAVTIYKKGNDSINNSMKNYDEIMNQFDTIQWKKYDNATVLGSQIIELLKELEPEDVVTIEVRNGASTKGQEYTYAEIQETNSTVLSDIVDKTNSEKYINPRASFMSTLEYDKNNELCKVIFQQK